MAESDWVVKREIATIDSHKKGTEIRVREIEAGGTSYIDIREFGYLERSHKWIPTKRGLRLLPRETTDLTNALLEFGGPE